MDLNFQSPYLAKWTTTTPDLSYSTKHQRFNLIWLIAWCNIILIYKLKNLDYETFCRNGVSGAQETLELSRGLGGGRGGVEAPGGPGQGPPSGHLPNMRHNGKLHNYRTSSVDYCPGLCLPSFLEDNLNIMNLKVLLRSMGWPGGVSL